MAETLIVMGRVPGTKGHVTFAFRANCRGDDRQKFILDMALALACLLPLKCRINPKLIKVGKKKELDAYQIILVDRKAEVVLTKFWDTQQRRTPGQEMFPFNLHVTLNSPEKRKGMKTLLEKGDTFNITEVFMRTLITKEIVVELVDK
jgi:hypothetical protein